MNLQRAIEIALEAHDGQVDKAGEPYILHPLRVMIAMETEVERIVGVLHDVIEDTEWMLVELGEHEGFSETVLEALDAVTRCEGEPYFCFINRVSRNDVARRVKMADLRDNMNLSRIAKPMTRDFDRMNRYGAALLVLRNRT